MGGPFDIDPDGWARLRQLLDQALQEAPGAREAWLAALPTADAAFAPRLRLLLAHAPALQGGTAVPSPLGDAPADVAARLLQTLPKVETGQFAGRPATAMPAEQVGPYRLLHELGHGGMASVWLAERTDVLQGRHAAIKLPLGAWHGAGLAERLARERAILATLNHPNIATMYDAGVDQAGRPWLALEYVQGERIDVHCERMKLDIPARLRLMVQVVQAVAHAHANLVVHRDLKPGNILVTADGRVKLLDFGIAKLLEQDLLAADATALTQQAGRALTPDYAAPEQILGRPVGTAADVYALGVVLYELLAGVRPCALARESRGALETAIAQLQPPPPSSAAAARGEAWQRALRGDLDTIVGKAMKPEPAERYATAAAVAEDLQLHLSGEPVRAQPDTARYRLQKFVGRHRLGVALAGGALAAIFAGSAAALVQTLAAREQTAIARSEAASAEQAQTFLEEMIKSATPEQAMGRDVTVRDMVERAARQLATDPPSDALLRARMRSAIGYTLHRLGNSHEGPVLIEQAVADARALGASGQRALAVALLYLSEVRGRADDHAAAQAHLREGMEIKRRVGETDDRIYNQLVNELGLALRATAPREALALFRQRHAELVSRHGELHDGSITLLANIGSQQIRLFDYSAARDTLERALPLVRKGMGEAHPLVGVVLGNLALVERRLGHHERAVALQREDLTLSAKVQGPRHPDVGASWLGLANILIEQGSPAPALAALNEAIPIFEEGLGPRHGRTLLGLAARAQAFNMLGRPESARQTLREAMKSPPEGPEARISFAWLRLFDAELDRQKGLYAEAVGKAEELRADEVASRDRNIIARAHVLSACALAAAGQSPQAMDQFDKAVAVRKAHQTALPWSAHTDAARWAACRHDHREAAQALRAAIAAGFADRSLLAEPDFALLLDDASLAALRPAMSVAAR